METNLARARSWLVQQDDAINWDYRGSPDAYVGASTAGLDLFTYDFMAHPRHSVAGALTRLPLPDNAVDIAVCANFLFAYSEMSDATETVSAPRLAQAASSDLLAGVGGTSSSIWPVVHAERRALVEDLVGLEAAPRHCALAGPSVTLSRIWRPRRRCRVSASPASSSGQGSASIESSKHRWPWHANGTPQRR